MPNYRRTYGANTYDFTVVRISAYPHPERWNTGGEMADRCVRDVVGKERVVGRRVQLMLVRSER